MNAAPCRTSPNVDALSYNGKVTVNGATLKVNLDSLEGTLTAGQELRVMKLSTSINGIGFTEIEPLQPAPGLYWDTSRLASEGVLAISPEVTGISKVQDEEEKVKGQRVYDLRGQRVVKTNRGVYIKDGRKVIVK